MVTKRELIDAMSELSDDDEVIVALRKPKDDEDDAGFSETEGTDAKNDDEDSEDPGYIECPVDATEVVDAADESGAKALLLYADIPDGDEDDTIYVDDEGHYVDSDDNYVDKEGNPSDTPVKADPEDLEDEGEDA